MKVIDLLNRIANGEEVPKKIRVEGEWIYGIEFEQDDYKHYKYKNIDDTYNDLFDDLDNLDLDGFLNTEIIEEDKKIEKINLKGYKSCLGTDEEWTSSEDIIIVKINEIIDYLNKEE